MANKEWVGGASGNLNDWGTADNWAPTGVPIAADNVTIGPRDTMFAIAGSDQSGVALGDVLVLEGFKPIIGSRAAALQIDPDKFEFAGGGESFIDLGSAPIDVIVHRTAAATASTGDHGLNLKGTAIDDLHIMKGNVGIASQPFEVATIATLRIGFSASRDSDVAVKVYSGVTLTTLRNQAGKNILEPPSTSGSITIVGTGGRLTTEGQGNQAITATLQGAFTLISNALGTITATMKSVNALLDLQRGTQVRLAVIDLDLGGKYKANPDVVTVTLTEPTIPSQVTVAPS